MSRFDSLFGRLAGPLLSRQLGRSGSASVIRLARGDDNARHRIDGCIVLRDNADVSRLAADSGYLSDSEGEREVEMAIIEVPLAYEVDSRDQWIFDGEVWEAVGLPKGRDAAFKTVLVKFVTRETSGPLNARRR
jgi:hypothetical protein